jgi:hypothetical protein
MVVKVPYSYPRIVNMLYQLLANGEGAFEREYLEEKSEGFALNRLLSSILLKRILQQSEASFKIPAAEDKKARTNFYFFCLFLLFFLFPGKFLRAFPINKEDIFCIRAS